jgi:hypothetical protein
MSNKKNRLKKVFYGMIFASSKPRTKKVWHKICYGCHFGRFRAISAILAVSLAIAHLASR